MFDKNQVENVIAGLRLMPEKIIFVGFKDTMTKRRISDLEHFFELKKIKIKIEYEEVERYDFQKIVIKFEEIIKNNKECCFDLTGGKELILTAMGEVSARYNIPMIQFNIRTGKIIKVKNCEKIIDINKSCMNINECVTLNGGSIVYDSCLDFEWDLNDDFKKDIEKIWNICKKDCTLWNKQSKILGNIDQTRDQKDLKVKIYSNYNGIFDRNFARKLKEYGLILDYYENDNMLSFRYKNEQVRRCILKAGNVLELYIYMIAHEINKEKCYSDIDIGVTVDWDGLINNCRKKIKIDTRNEIDVMLMKDMIPVFISCKNGVVHKEALYELFTVAEKFGGKYSKKILVTTSDNESDSSFKYIIQRAHDMNIRLIYGIDKMSREKLKDFLKKSAK